MSTAGAQRTFVDPDEAHEIISNAVGPLPSEEVPLERAIDRILASDFEATIDLPPFDNSAMDGFAVRAEDLKGAAAENPVKLALRETIRAGRLAQSRLEAGEAMKIMTGAPMPVGADSVVMKECSRPAPDGVELLISPKRGEHVRYHGEDVKKGDVILKAGAVLRSYEISMLASHGAADVRVIRRPKVAVATSGDELVHHSETPGPGQIRNSNGPALAALLRRWGAEPIPCGIAVDEEDAIRALLEDAFKRADVLLITGGVSVGDFDLTHKVLSSLGFEALFWKTAIKPGKPLLFGLWEGKPVFGLPGNPVSALVCTEEFVRPALERMQGKTGGPPGYHLRGKAINSYAKPGDRRQYVFCTVDRKDGNFELNIIRPQGSAMLAMACRADALAVAPIGVTRIDPGMELEFRWIK